MPFPSPGDLPNPGIEPESPALTGGFFITEPTEKSNGYGDIYIYLHTYIYISPFHPGITVNIFASIGKMEEEEGRKNGETEGEKERKRKGFGKLYEKALSFLPFAEDGVSSGMI